MKCQLCLGEKELINRSHIVPNFLYKSILQIERKLVSVNLSDLSSKGEIMQTGYNEGGLLCADCDNRILGSLERYACNHIYTEPTEKSSVTKKFYPGIKI